MKKVFSILFFGLVATACREELTPLKPPVDPPFGAGCQAPSIEKNILGTWQYVSTYNRDNAVTMGTVTFDRFGKIIDPDSLFENQLDLGKVTSKIYKPSVPYQSPNYNGDVFEVYQFTGEGKKQIAYFTVVNNECKKIHLSLLLSTGNKTGFVLTR